jgi:predicted nucleotide-binding protein
MTKLDEEFRSITAEAASIAGREVDLDEEGMSALESAAKEVGRSWSKSSLGYQANVYYEGFKVPPPGHIFSREWGFLNAFYGTIGDWKPYDFSVVVAYVEELAGTPDSSSDRELSDVMRGPVNELIQRARSAVARFGAPQDDYLKENIEELQKIALPRVGKLATSLMNITNGRFVVRDTRALEGGWQVAGHQQVIAEIMYVRSPYVVARRLAEICGRLARHLTAYDPSEKATMVQLGSKVFIGHGGNSKEYLQLGVWLTDEGLEWEVFDRKPTAGRSVKERLAEMLDNAWMAFLLMTAEDETAEGKMRARENVVHEIGLFQGRLGFTRAIVLLEDSCEEFSNISGLGQIRFPRGNIKAAFDEIRKVLQREGMFT